MPLDTVAVRPGPASSSGGLAVTATAATDGPVDHLARLYPAVTGERDPIFVRDGHVWTSAGVTAGIDLALALVREAVRVETAQRLLTTPGQYRHHFTAA